MSLLNVIRALLAFRHDRKYFSETMNRDLVDLHIRQDFNDFPRVISNHYTKQRKFVIFTGTTHTKKFGSELARIMRKEGYNVTLKSIDTGTPSIDVIKEMAPKFTYRIPIGVGGGSILDFAKLIGNELGNKPVSVPTTLSHDGIASPVASCMDGNRRVSVRVLRPSPIYANFSIIGEVHRFNVSGIGEAMSNYTAIRDWRNSAYVLGKDTVGFSKVSSFFATVAYGYWLRREIKRDKGKITQDTLDLLIASHFFSGILMELAGSSAPCSGAEHLLSHALDELYPNKTSLHGEQVGMFSIVIACLQSELFRNLGITSRDAIKLKRTLDLVGAPTCFRDLGIKKITRDDLEILFDLARNMGKSKNRYTILKHVEFPDFLLALNKTGVWIG
ncbi:MAG: iron-containing alcohol dehydrogenase [Candidatus Woesearchaeota archaeon]|nr:MAG: iron-containing alcohol dehydrogenase [Candidatus Woesearchaeota archaeon]